MHADDVGHVGWRWRIGAGLLAPPGGGPSVGYRGGPRSLLAGSSFAIWSFSAEGSSIGGGFGRSVEPTLVGLYSRSSVHGLVSCSCCAVLLRLILRLRIVIVLLYTPVRTQIPLDVRGGATADQIGTAQSH